MHGGVEPVWLGQLLTRPEGHHQRARLGVQAQGRCNGDRLRFAAALCAEQRRTVEGHAPPLIGCGGDIELPQIALQIACIDKVGRAVSGDVEELRCGQTVAVALAVAIGTSIGPGHELLEFAITIKILNQQHRPLVRTVVAVAQNHRPALVVGPRDL